MIRTLATAVATLVVVAGAGCARVPVVTSPAFPDFVFPNAPAAYASSPLAREQRAAWAFLQAGDLGRAEDRFGALLEEDDAFFPASVGLGWVLVAQGRAADAIGYFEAGLDRAAGYVPALIGRGEALLRTDAIGLALASFEAALAADPGLDGVARVAAELRLRVMSERLTAARDAAAQGRLGEATAAYAAVIAASPASGFLYLERARVIAQQDDLAAALDDVRQAARLDPNDANAPRFEGALLEAVGDQAAAVDAYRRAEAIAPDAETADRLARAETALRLRELPQPYQTLADRGVATRGDLAALVGVELRDLIADAAAGRPTPIVVDTREHWAAPWIVTVAQAGVMEVEAGNRFAPERQVRRGDLADVVGGVLDLIGAANPEAAAGWRDGRPRFRDMGEGHLNYQGAAQAVAAGVLPMPDDDRFEPTRAVTGADALVAVQRLAQLAADQDRVP